MNADQLDNRIGAADQLRAMALTHEMTLALLKQISEENKELKRDLKEIRKGRSFMARIRHPEYWMPILAGGVAIAIAIMGYFDGKNATPPGQTVALSPNAEGGDGASRGAAQGSVVGDGGANGLLRTPESSKQIAINARLTGPELKTGTPPD